MPEERSSELQALIKKAKQLESQKVLQLGELVIAIRAEALDPETLMGALFGVVKSKDARERKVCRANGAAFFQRQSRKADRGTPGHAGGNQASQVDDEPR